MVKSKSNFPALQESIGRGHVCLLIEVTEGFCESIAFRPCSVAGSNIVELSALFLAKVFGIFQQRSGATHDVLVRAPFRPTNLFQGIS